MFLYMFQQVVSALSLKKIEPEDPIVVAPVKKTPLKRSTGHKKGLRFLSDMPDEDWGMPDCCLQKTAEVRIQSYNFFKI